MDMRFTCEECGEESTASVEMKDNGDVDIRVHPCRRCLEEQYSYGYRACKRGDAP